MPKKAEKKDPGGKKKPVEIFKADVGAALSVRVLNGGIVVQESGAMTKEIACGTPVTITITA